MTESQEKPIGELNVYDFRNLTLELRLGDELFREKEAMVLRQVLAVARQILAKPANRQSIIDFTEMDLALNFSFSGPKINPKP